MTTRTELIASLRSHVIDHKRDNKAADMLEADAVAARLALSTLEGCASREGVWDAITALKEALT
jgi:hypothetical protein